ncbi:MAG TPA: thiamine pyrophosphate-requiring protein [Solirubrobacteraceae bacterium]|jgi:thiamine pyrophosphate-dependent acetolactate synthase large subunit-like protein|nr:thiamine pyrophosphate-requiring protein [Solirubrobacteraceae bacterium]
MSQTLVSDKIAGLLQQQGAELIVGFPENRLLDSAAALGMRPIITRTERVAVNIADGFARMTNGERFVPCVMQYGPGAEAAHAAVAQAFGDRSPILLIPGEHARAAQADSPTVGAAEAYRTITAWSATVNEPDQGPGILRRALQAVRGARRGPVLVAVANDVLYATAADDRPWEVSYPGARRSQADPADVDETSSILAAATSPVIVAGQGVLYAEATEELVALAEALELPVATTLNGKSAFPEDHPLSLGAAARTRPATVDRAFERADVILGVGTSFSRSLYITPMPLDARLGQIVNDPRDLATGYDVGFACVGDVKLVLRQLVARLQTGAGGAGREDGGVRARIASTRRDFHEAWLPHLTSEAAPLSPYRVVWELMHAVDRQRTVVTHDAGHPRDQMVPFYETIVPRGYLGWGKSTQLGTGLGLAMGARLARPDWLSVNVMGDAAFGMVGMDLETAARCRIPILTVVLNNGLMGGYTEYMPEAVARYDAHKLGGDYRGVARALGVHAERAERPDELGSALQRCIACVSSGRPALLEAMTHEEPTMSMP